MAASGILFCDPRVKPLSTAGTFQSGSYFCFFYTGTTTPTNVYADGTLNTPLSQPAPASVNPTGGTVAASDGRLVPIYLSPATVYRVQLYNAAGTLLEDTDPYVVPANTNSFSQGAIGAILYPTSSAETAASAVPVNFQYPYGTPDRFATNTTPGTTDMTAAWQAALNSSMEVNALPGRLYAVTNTGLTDIAGASISLNVPSGVKVNLHGATVRKIGTTTQGAIFGSSTTVGVNATDRSNIRIENGIIDCAGIASGAVIHQGTDCDLGPFLTVLAPAVAPGGIGLGHRAGNQVTAHGRNRIVQCRVQNALFIGVQCAHQPLGVHIYNNIVENSTDNAIDVEANIGLLTISITNILAANPAVITFSNGASNLLEVGGEISFSGVSGMTQINGRTGTVSAVGGSAGAWTVTMGGVGGYGGIDSSAFSAYTSGGTGQVAGSSRRSSVIGNTVNGVSGDCGIFVESMSNVLVDDNTIENLTSAGAAGIKLNQINTQSFENIVTSNRIKNIPNGYGIVIAGSGKARIDDNSFKTMVNAVRFQGPSSFVSLGRNTCENITGNSLIYFSPSSGQYTLIWSGFEPQDYFGATAAGVPFTASPIDNVANPNTVLNGQNRTLFASPVATRYLQSGVQAVADGTGGFTDLQVEYKDGANGVLAIDGSFAGQYSLFTGGVTQIAPTVAGSAWVVGDYIQINGTVKTLYKLATFVSGNIFTIQQANFPVATTAPPFGTSATLTSGFAGKTGTYLTYFTDGQTKNVSYTNGSTAISWTGALTGSPGVNLLVMNVDGNWTSNFTGAHPCTGFYPLYQVETGT